MDKLTEEITIIGDALPNHIHFYHLGEVTLKNEIHTNLDEIDDHWPQNVSIGFRLSGDLKALLILLFSKDLDSSTYYELGNLLASQIANKLHSQQGLSIFISPPVQLNAGRVIQILRLQKKIFCKTYVHSYKNLLIPIETLVLPDLTEEMGHA
jgi:hypothetical protein